MTLLALAGVLADLRFGEPTRWHPLVGFGRFATWLERAMNPASRHRPDTSPAVPSNTHLTGAPVSQGLARTLGIVAWMLAVLPPVALSCLIIWLLPPWAGWLVHIALLWFALGGNSLVHHIAPIGRALEKNDLPAARALASRVVSRDLSSGDADDVARAAIESALENGNDAVFAALFWFLIGGGPAALAFRLINTLDAMWGYRTPRLRYFGCAAARIDDLANWPAARITAAIYCFLGNTRSAWTCWRTQAPSWDSPNAGPVMAAGAGALGVLLGGPAIYNGTLEHRPILGCGVPPAARDVQRALRLVQTSTWCCLLLAALLTWALPFAILLPHYVHALIQH